MTTFEGSLYFAGGGAGLHHQRYTADHADFTAAAVTEAVSQSVTLPIGAKVQAVSHKLTTPFTGGTISAATIDVGVNGGNTDQYVDAVNAFAAAIKYTPATGDGSADLLAITATTIDITLTTTGDNVINADAGAYAVDIYYTLVTADPDDQ